ncbi:MAG: DNA methylase [Oscillospiraceae bacterium]|nr:DNA methylase [Oscillospiraceae bacterium]
MAEKTYIAIDLKSFYASVECKERGLDPLTTHLVVADESRTEKTICLAVSPSLKAYGISGRPRLFEVVQAVREINRKRRENAPGHSFTDSSSSAVRLAENPSLELDYIVAMPRMAYYMEYSTRIYQIYMKYVSPEDMHVYSVDEVFIDATRYLQRSGKTAREFTRMLIQDVLDSTGITATAGIGSNMYLCKIAMDIVAKHLPPDSDGVRIAELDEMGYRETLWNHRPLTDFWRVGRGIAGKLEANGMYTMGDVARCSVGNAHDRYNEELLYQLFGVNAELLIDHAWGWENCSIADIRAYRPENSSLSVGQVLSCPYDAKKAAIIIREMTEGLVLDLVVKGLVTDQVVLTLGYDNSGVTPEYTGAVILDGYGRKAPKHAHGTENLGRQTSSTRLILEAMLRLYERIVDPRLFIRRMYVVANHVVPASSVKESGQSFEQLDLFVDYEEKAKREAADEERLLREQRLQEAMLGIKKRYGKNAILHGTSYQDGATGRERNEQIGGHRR